MSNPWSTAPGAPTLPPPAWYPDPSGVGELRFWNGTAWTPGVVIAGEVVERPMPWPPVARDSTPPDERAQLPGRAALYGLLGFVIGAVGGLALALAGTALNLPDIAVLLLNVAGLWSGLLWACQKASRRYGTGDIRRDFGLVIQGSDIGWGLLMSLAARMAGAIVVIPFLLGPERFLGDNQGVFGEVTDNLGTFLVFAFIAVVGAPIVEELFFRGLLLRSLTTVLGTAGAVAASSVLFGLAHVSPLLGLANLSVVAIISAAGVVFGITAWWRRTGTSAMAHAAFNLVSVIAVGLLTFT